jgi:hypothetical protein
MYVEGDFFGVDGRVLVAEAVDMFTIVKGIEGVIAR